MKSEQKIREELEKHVNHRKEICNDLSRKNEKKIHDIVIETLLWVLKDN